MGYIIRKFDFLAQRLDVVELLDEFASRFYQELDYVLECNNGVRIAEEMRVLPMVVKETANALVKTHFSASDWN